MMSLCPDGRPQSCRKYDNVCWSPSRDPNDSIWARPRPDCVLDTMALFWQNHITSDPVIPPKKEPSCRARNRVLISQWCALVPIPEAIIPSAFAIAAPANNGSIGGIDLEFPFFLSSPDVALHLHGHADRSGLGWFDPEAGSAFNTSIINACHRVLPGTALSIFTGRRAVDLFKT